MEKIRLQKFFTDNKIMSRRNAEKVIEAGNVKINGVIAKLGEKVDPEKDTVTYNGKVLKYENDESVLKRLEEIKALKKKQFADFAYKKQGSIIDPNSLFDVQAKRLHEYKRQLLNVLHVITDYIQLKENPDMPMQPKTYIFAAKAAAGYYMAKKIIKLICFLAEDIKKNPKIREKFVKN